MLIDTHCHLMHPPLSARLADILAEAAAQDVRRFLVPGTRTEDWIDIVTLAQANPCIHIALGVHPWYAAETTDIWPELAALLRAFPSALVGEIGLDFLHAPEAAQRQQQTAVFETQLSLAQSLDRAVVVHNVRASEACLNSIRRCRFYCGGFAHGFSGSLEEAREWVKCGFKIGMGSLLLRPRARKIHRIAAELPLSYMVLETDAPYMSPERNTPNYPGRVRQIAEHIAAIKQISYTEVALQTTRNAQRFF